MVYQTDRDSQPQFKPPGNDRLGEDDFLPWTVTPPTGARNDLRVPYKHFALIALDANGNIRTHSSRSLRKSHQILFTPEFRDNFVHYTGVKGEENVLAGKEYSSQQPGQQEIDLFSPLASRKRRREPSQYKSLETVEYRQQLQETEKDFTHDKTKDRVPIEIGDEQKIIAYYKTSFMALQQLSCRHIAKSYIKAIEPRKQVKHPYNGGRGGPGEKGDPEKTKPDWWPAGVIHREPDHLRKPDRLQLLIHIFRNLSKSHGITADKLEEAGQDAHRKIEQADRRELLDEIYRVRRVEESYERGEIDANTVIYVMNREPATKTAEREESVSDFGPGQSPSGDAEHDAEHDIDPIEIAQTISTEPEQVRSAPQANLGLSEPPTPEQQKQQHQSRYQHQQQQQQQQQQQHTPFLEDSCPPMFTASTSDYEIKNKSSVQNQFGYFPPTGFVPPVEQPAMVGQWNAFQQQQQQQQPPIFLPVDYETVSTRQMMAPNLMQPTSQQHSMQPISETLVGEDSVPCLPDLPTARSQPPQFDFISATLPPSFRTGSLSHPHCVPVQGEPIVTQSTPRYKRLRYQ